VEFGGFELLREGLPVLDVVILGASVGRVFPEAVIEMAWSLHCKGIEDKLFLGRRHRDSTVAAEAGGAVVWSSRRIVLDASRDLEVEAKEKQTLTYLCHSSPLTRRAREQLGHFMPSRVCSVKHKWGMVVMIVMMAFHPCLIPNRHGTLLARHCYIDVLTCSPLFNLQEWG
jgi:hypothetical protein